MFMTITQYKLNQKDSDNPSNQKIYSFWQFPYFNHCLSFVLQNTKADRLQKTDKVIHMTLPHKSGFIGYSTYHVYDSTTFLFWWHIHSEVYWRSHKHIKPKGFWYFLKTRTKLSVREIFSKYLIFLHRFN